MWLTPIPLDAEMTAGEVLARLAANGLWLDPRHPTATERIDAVRSRSERKFEAVAKFLHRDPARYGATIRRQLGTRILWYARAITKVLSRCTESDAGAKLWRVLDLEEGDSDRPVSLGEVHESQGVSAVVLESGFPISVTIGVQDFGIPRGSVGLPPVATVELGGYRSGAGPVAAAPTGGHAPDAETGSSSAWPRIDAPKQVPALREFEVTVGFAPTRQGDVQGGRVSLPFSAEEPELDLTIELSAGPELTCKGDWRQDLRVRADKLYETAAAFRLVGSEPTNAARAWLTTLEVRYILQGKVCGVASRPLAIVSAQDVAGPAAPESGTEWTETGAVASAVVLVPDPEPPDLTIEISKPDGNSATGTYVCRLRSPHGIATPAGPFQINLGADARTFARQLVDEVRLFAGDPLLDSTLTAAGRLVAKKLPREFFAALAEVSLIAKPRPPAVLIVSAEPYVPWELAWVKSSGDPTRPAFLGAQAVVGRWLRDSSGQDDPSDEDPRPAVHPLGVIDVKRIAVMAAWYQAATGMRRLPMAEAEARTLASAHQGIELQAQSEQLRDLLGAKLRVGTDPVDVQAVHFAGHGDFDPTATDPAVLYLQNGKPVRSNHFRAAKYGGKRQPLIFLNACMLGIGGETLGDMGGFPGNSLRGGFGGVLGALWEVDDQVAHDIALEFWKRALPAAPGPGEPVADILRDLRARYDGDATPAPIATYLSYVFYGHPRLRLQRTA